MTIKKLLLGSTALIGAGALLATTADTAAAQEPSFTVKLAGYTEFLLQASENDLLNSNGDRGYAFDMDNELHIRAEGTLANGLTYGSLAELELGSDQGDNAFVDEIHLYFSGGFGRIELGREDSASDTMKLDASVIAAGTGGIDGDQATVNAISFEAGDTGDATKVTYYTPRVAGFQVGASFTPDSGDGVDDGITGDNNFGDFENNVEAGLNWSGAFAGLDLAVGGIFNWGKPEEPDALDNDDDRWAWDVGATLGFGGISAAGSFGYEYGPFDDDLETLRATGGLAAGIGAGNVSFTYAYVDSDFLDDKQHHLVGSFDYPLLPGVVFKADVAYGIDADIGDTDDDPTTPDEQDDTWAGVASIQLNY